MSHGQRKTDQDIESYRRAWLRDGLGEVDQLILWIKDKATRIVEMQRQRGLLYIEFAELQFDYFSTLNRLGHIHFRAHENIPEKKLIAWIEDSFAWPPHIAEAFWKCLRNPVMHMGRSSFDDYRVRHPDGVRVTAGFYNPLDYSGHPGAELYQATDRLERGEGWEQFLWPAVGEWPPEYRVTFILSQLLEMLSELAESVKSEIEVLSADKLLQLNKLNKRLPFYFYPSMDFMPVSKDAKG